MPSPILYDLFILYADIDRAWVEGYLLDALKQVGVRYHTESAFALGAVRLLEFERAIQQSQRTLLVLSPAYFAESLNQFVESLARSYGFNTATWPVIPLILQPVRLPPRLSDLVKLDATTPQKWKDAIIRLCKDLRQPIPAPFAEPPKCPYRGMMPFTEDMSDRFFGRDAEVEECLNCLRLDPFLTVIGSSGSGKSSLVFAGLIPKLRRSGLFGSGKWLVRTMRPGENPLAALKTTLGSDLTNLDLAVTEALSTSPNAQRLLLVVDQFEEVFTTGQEILPFQEILLRLVETHNCYLILTVRADFYSDLMGSPLWHKIQSHRLEVLPLDADGLRQAIIKPSESVDVFVELALVERLVIDAGREPGVLPLIQETLVLLWENLERRFLPLSVYEALVLLPKAYGTLGSGKLTGLQVAIARRADAAIADLSDEQQAIARHIFLRLIQFGEGRPDTRRQQSVDRLQAASDDERVFEETLFHLARCRLLTLSAGQDTSHRSRRVDICHEALISGWPTLQQWIAERREAEQTRRQLENKAEEWLRLGQGNGGLLDETELAEAERWLESPDAIEVGYTKVLSALVKNSQVAIEKAKQEKEEARQRELKQAQDLAEEQRQRANAERLRFEEQVRASKSLRIRFLMAVAFAFIAALFAVGAWQQTRLASVRRLTAQALTTSAERLDLGLLLGLEAYDMSERLNSNAEKLEARSNLFKILHANPRLTGYLHGDINGHREELRSIALNQNGTILASASSDAILLWDVAAQKLIDRLLLTDIKAFGLMDRGITFSPNGTKLAYGRGNGSIILWDLSSQNKKIFNKQFCTLTDPNGHSALSVRSIAFNPKDSNKLVSAGYDYKIVLWDIAKCKRIATYRDHSGPVNSIAFSQDGKLLASGGDGRQIILWHVEGDKFRHHECKFKTAPPIWITSLAFDPNHERLASGSSDYNLSLWNLKTCTSEILGSHHSFVNSVTFNKDGTKLASSSQDSTIIVWDVKTRQQISGPLIGHNGEVRSIVFDPMNSNKLVSGGYNRDIIWWDLNAPSHFGTTLDGHEGEVSSVDISRDGKLLASGSTQIRFPWKPGLPLWSGKIFLWKWNDKKSWQREGSPLNGEAGRVWSVTFSPDGTKLASGNDDQYVILWDVVNHKLLRKLNQTFYIIRSVTFNRDGTKLASSTEGGTLILWDVGNAETSKLWLSQKVLESERVRSMSFSPNNKWLATGSWHPGVVRLWKVVKDKKQGRLEEVLLEKDPNIGLVNSVAFSPDSKTLAAGGFSHFLLLWDIKTRKRLTQQLIAHRTSVNSVAFSRHPDREILLASGGNDGNIILWIWNPAIRNLEPIAQWRGHNDIVTSMAFSWDNKKLISGGKDGNVKVWEVSLDKWRERACRIANRNLTRKEWNEFIPHFIYNGKIYGRTCHHLPLPSEASVPLATTTK